MIAAPVRPGLSVITCEGKTMTQSLSAAVSEKCDCGMIRGFEIHIHAAYSLFRAAKDHQWQKHGVHIQTRAEFGNSPIRDLKARQDYMATLDWHGLEYTVHPIMAGDL